MARELGYFGLEGKKFNGNKNWLNKK